MTIQDWLRGAIEDADRRGLPALAPLLEALSRSTAALREADQAARRRDAEAEAGSPRDAVIR
ncbi:MAG: hypothetical protein ABIP65_11845 [Vicinamibacterales bacterium]